jgi:hypothetical protein
MLARWCALAAVVAVGGAVAATPPDGRDETAREIALANAGFEAAATPAGHPPAWIPIGHASVDSYTYALTGDVRRSGARSLRIANVGPEPFGAIVQKLVDPSMRGRTVRFSAWLRTERVTGNSLGGGAVLMLQAMRNGVPVAHNHMRGGAVKGTTDWQRYTITLAIPQRADDVEVGAMLFGPGIVWLDDATLEILGR